MSNSSTTTANSSTLTASDSSPNRPRVFLLSLSSPVWFDEMYTPLIDKLFSHATIQRASKPDAAVRYLSTKTPTAILVTDGGLTQPEHSHVLDKVLRYTRAGGVLILCCQFSSSLNGAQFNQFMRSKLNLPWEFGDYLRTTFYLNQHALSAANRALTTNRLLPYYSQKAVHMKNVDNANAVYLPGSDSVIETFLWQPGELDMEQTPVVFRNFGQGSIGYVGDVNREEGSEEVILAMCGF